jgi:SHS2 domain-containing protein
VGVKIYGCRLEELFLNAAAAMFSLIYNLEDVEGQREEQINVVAEEIESLLVRWLAELLYLYDAKGLLYKDAVIQSLCNRSLSARVFAEEFDPKRHKVHGEVKNVTYHQLCIRQMGDGWYAQIIFDV